MKNFCIRYLFKEIY